MNLPRDPSDTYNVITMRLKLVSIGNSKGLRIPKTLLDQCGLNGEVQLDVRGGALVIRPLRSARQGWEEAFAKMRGRGDDRLLDETRPSTWDRKEWTW